MIEKILQRKKKGQHSKCKIPIKMNSIKCSTIPYLMNFPSGILENLPGFSMRMHKNKLNQTLMMGHATQYYVCVHLFF